MTSASLRERYALDVFEPIWRAKGYAVLREPTQNELPAFLKGFRPDAIATGAEPALVIEVVAGQGAAKESVIRRLKSAIDGQNHWRLELIYVGSEGAPIKPVSGSAAEATLRRAQNLSRSEPEAALLLAWAALEAVTRLLEPKLSEYTLGALALVDLLVGYGHLSQEDGAKLRSLAAVRNRLAHGELDASPSAEDVCSLASIVEALLREASAATLIVQ